MSVVANRSARRTPRPRIPVLFPRSLRSDTIFTRSCVRSALLKLQSQPERKCEPTTGPYAHPALPWRQPPENGAVGSTRNVKLRGIPRSSRRRFYHVPISKSAIISRFVQDSPTGTAVKTGNLENLHTTHHFGLRRTAGISRRGCAAVANGPTEPTIRGAGPPQRDLLKWRQGETETACGRDRTRECAHTRSSPKTSTCTPGLNTTWHGRSVVGMFAAACSVSSQ